VFRPAGGSQQTLEFQPQGRLGDRQKTHPQFRGDLAAGNDMADGYCTAQNAFSNDDVRLSGHVGSAPAVSHR